MPPNSGIYLSNDRYQQLNGDLFAEDARGVVADTWQQQATAALPDLVAEAQRQAEQQAQAQRNQMADQFMASVQADPALAAHLGGTPAPTESPQTAPTDAMAAPVAPAVSTAPEPAPAPPTQATAPTLPAPDAPVTAPMSAATGWEVVARAAAQKYGIDPDIFARQIGQESNFNPAARSAAGAIGIAQFMPATAQSMGIDPTDPSQALDAAARLMASHLQTYGGDYGKALAAYNAGPGNVDKYGGVPPFAETQQYVSNILGGVGKAAAGAAQAVQTAVRDPGSILDAVKPFLGQAYVWGGKSPQQGWDCSGLAGYLTTGQPESTVTLYGKSSAIGQDQAQPGDLVFWNMGTPDPHLQHVGVYLGNGQIVQSGGNQARVNIGSVDQAIGSPPEFRRLGPGGAPAQATAAPAQAGLADQTAASTTTPPPGILERLQQIGPTIGSAISDAFSNLFGGGAAANRAPGQSGAPIYSQVPDITQPQPPTPTGVPTDPLGQAANNLQLAGTDPNAGPIGLTRSAVQSVVQPAADALADSGLNAARREYFPNITEPGHPLNPATPLDENAALLLGGMTAPIQSANPLIQRTAQMLEAKPPAPATQGLVERIIQATTNRTVAADRYQEDALRAAGLSTANPPQSLDLSAALRLASDPAAEIRIQQGLRPALQAVGDERGWLSAYLMHANNVDVAPALGNVDRTFPGGFKAADSAQVLSDLPAELGPQRFGTVQQAAGQIYDFTKQLRQRMVDSGLIDGQTAQQWEQQYPHWVPTRVLDYMDEAGGPRVGAKISLSDNGVKKYTEEGTARFAEDPLASLIGLARQVESKAMKNDAANALVELDQLRPAGQRLLVPTDRPVTAGESVIQRINNGTVERYVAPPPLAAVINGPQINQAPGFVRAWTNFQRAVTTVLSPAFALVRNPSLDIPEYLTRELARSGGNPLAIPHLVAELASGYADAFKGFNPLTEGTFAGQGAQQFMLGGGGSAAEVPRTFAQRGDVVARLAQDGVSLTSAEDLGRVLRDLVTLKPVARTAERTELGPRIASMRLAEQRGATPVRAIINGRTVTLDFNEGGTVAKTINQVVPFFNAGIQGSAQVLRMYRENPTGAVLSAMTMAGLPAVAAEAWNNSDPQRAKDYQDVPGYLKSQGVVVMMPGDAPTDDRGNRRPQFWWVNMRGLAPFSSLAREAAAHVLQAGGNGSVQPDDWGNLLGDMLGNSSPIRANTIGDVPGSLLPNTFGVATGLQLNINKDFFRNADIVNPRKDQYASAVGWTVANALTTLARLHDPSWQVHPSQVDFVVKDLLGGVGSSAIGLGDIVAGQRRDSAIQSAPVLGGIARAAGIRGDTGAQLSEARQQILTPQAQRIVNDAGLATPPPEPGVIHYKGYAIPLLQVEQARYQQLYSQYVSANIEQYGKDLTSIPDAVAKQKLMAKLSQNALQQAQGQILQSIPPADLNQRIKAELDRQRGVAPVPAR